MNTFGYHCLYFDRDHVLSGESGLIPFCIRPETFTNSDDHDDVCYGNQITFSQLKLINISASDLFQWNAVIEIIELYEKYLLTSDLINDNEVYCNCSSSLQFGKFCQYIFNDVFWYSDESSFTELIDTTGRRSNVISNEVMNTEYVTCYIGIHCQTNLYCLDWRQICNGIVDCDYGEDEPFELCLQMELNECDNETEFRCKNGLCIPTSFAFTATETCLDRSDAIKSPDTSLSTYLFRLCTEYPSFDCDETNHGWKRFSCGDGQYILYSDLTSKISQKGKTCQNKYDLIYLKNMLIPHNENQCWISMICLTGFNYLYSNIKCLNNTNEIINIEKYCPDEYYFPPNSIIYSYVFFLYMKTERTNWLNYTGPNYVCYKKDSCQNNLSSLSTIIKGNFICVYVDQNIFSWKNFPEYVIYLFASCYISSPTSDIYFNDKMLYKCNLSETFISVYRLKDKSQDCFLNEDENMNLNICLLNSNNHFKCLTDENECIQRTVIYDDQYDCLDGSDEYFEYGNDICGDDDCAFQIRLKQTLPQIYRFDELCDRIVNYHLFSIQSNETDETDCQYWPYSCNSVYTRCNQVWNCKNGIDEINCDNAYFSQQTQKSFHCNSFEHYCIQLVNENNDINMTCININRTGDGIIDCIGGTDERLTNICLQKYPMQFEKRFYCMNSSICIRPDQICDTVKDCPYEDDERICPWLFNKNSSKFYCNNSQVVDRCTKPRVGTHNCEMKENLWFCDLALKNQRNGGSPSVAFTQYPVENEQILLNSFNDMDSNNMLLSKQTALSSVNSDTDQWLCKQGYPIQALSSNNKTYCLCSPSYYGDSCQYQSERLTILFDIRTRYYLNPLTVFRLMIYLLDENNMTISYDEIVFNEKVREIHEIIVVYLLDKRSRNQSLYDRFKSKYVRIDSYIINQTNAQYISSWLFPVKYPFLPVNRLAVLLFLEDELFKIRRCKKKCSSHGKCMYYINSKHIEYCWCDQGWYGEKCHLKSVYNLCNRTSCAPDSQCIILNDEKQQIKCICPLGKAGQQCYIKSNVCFNDICQNNGTCLSLDQRSFGYVCICTNDYFGPNCELRTKFHNIFIPSNITDLSSIPVIVVIFTGKTGNMFQQVFRQSYINVPLPITLNMTGRVQFGFIQMFYNVSKSFYYMIAIQLNQVRQLNTTVIPSNLCKNVSEIFNETILYEYSYLKRLKLYHLPCKENKELRCFYDQYRMCLCTRQYNSDCALFYHEHSYCNYCKNNGLCLKRNPVEPQWDYICLCPRCTFGSICQFSTQNYFINFDMLIGVEMKPENSSFHQQPLIIHLTLITLILILIVSFILNTITIMILSNKRHRQVGCDIYLLNLTIISQIGLMILFLRYIYMIIIQIYTVENLLFIQVGCMLFEYTLRLIPSLFDWLTACISVERAYTVIKDINFTRSLALKTLKLSRWIIFLIVLLNILSTLHRPFYLILVDKLTLTGEQEGHPWCVLDFGLTSWNIYEKFINIFHLIIPLLMNLISLLLFLLRKTNTEITSTIKRPGKSRFVILKEQLLKYKPLVISTIIIILLEIPRFIFTFSLSCIEHRWQRYTYLIGYLTSFLPLTGLLFIYIIPSPKYQKDYRRLMKKLCCGFFFKNNAERN